MRLKISLTVLFLLILPSLPKAQEPNWLAQLKQQKWMDKVSSLKVLETNRVEAEKILGKPDRFDNDTNDSIEYYSLNNGRVTLTYTTKECTSAGGKIPKDTIEDISFRPESHISLSKLKLPLKQFKFIRNFDMPGGNYENEKYGVSISFDENKIVHSISFKTAERENFSCVTVASFLSDLDKARNLKLLESNREDVRKIFAGYKKSNDFTGSEYKDRYYTDDATIEFFYSQGKCYFDDSDEYDSAEWNIERIDISPDNNIDPQEFEINLAQYKKEKVYRDINNLYVYYNKDSGISFQVSENRIFKINLFPHKNITR